MVDEIGIAVVANRYAQAILELGEEKQALHYLKNDFPAVVNLMIQSKVFEDYLTHPLISRKDKKDTIDQIFKDKISPYLINLMKVLLDRNRIYAFKAIAESFKKLYNRKYNILEAEIVTSVYIDDQMKESIRQKLSTLLSKEVEVSSKINPEIIGGVVVRIEDRLIDGSIKGRLDSIKRQLM